MPYGLVIIEFIPTNDQLLSESLSSSMMTRWATKTIRSKSRYTSSISRPRSAALESNSARSSERLCPSR